MDYAVFDYFLAYFHSKPCIGKDLSPFKRQVDNELAEIVQKVFLDR
jgi:hypothetical protein